MHSEISISRLPCWSRASRAAPRDGRRHGHGHGAMADDRFLDVLGSEADDGKEDGELLEDDEQHFEIFDTQHLEEFE